ncbi:MAG TPA: hypothetical protein VGL08_01625 [Paraburkholderia sp.]|jgi:hypothetical protein
MNRLPVRASVESMCTTSLAAVHARRGGLRRRGHASGLSEKKAPKGAFLVFAVCLASPPAIDLRLAWRANYARNGPVAPAQNR